MTSQLHYLESGDAGGEPLYDVTVGADHRTGLSIGYVHAYRITSTKRGWAYLLHGRMMAGYRTRTAAAEALLAKRNLLDPWTIQTGFVRVPGHDSPARVLRYVDDHRVEIRVAWADGYLHDEIVDAMDLERWAS